jgi:antitoxin (DNA-binding transcriptional repressor) of toxin-antitoxin stability system
MVTIDVDEFADRPLDALRRVEVGEIVLILCDNIPVAQLQPAATLNAKPTLRPFGLAHGLFTVPDDFDAPLPENEIKLFEGE